MPSRAWSRLLESCSCFDLVCCSRKRCWVCREPESAHAGRGTRERSFLALNFNQEAASLQMVIRVRAVFIHARFAAGIGPHAALPHLARGRHLGRLTSLLIDVSLYHLGRQTRRQLPVLSAFEQHTHNDVRIAPRREPHKPPVLSEVFVILMLRAQSQRNNLCRPGLAGDVDTLNVRRRSRTFRQQYSTHRIRNRVPSRRVNRNFFYFLV